MFEHARHSAVARLHQYHQESEAAQSTIQYINGELQKSAFFQRVAVESLLTALTAGAAGRIGSAIGARIAGRLGGATLGQGAGARSLQLLAELGGYAATESAFVVRGVAPGLLAGEALSRMLGRIAAGLVIQQPIRAAAGDFTWRGLAVGFFTAIIGRPGMARDSRLGVKIFNAGDAWSYQSAAAFVAECTKGFVEIEKAAQNQDRAFLELIESLHAQYDDPIGLIRELAETTVAETQRFLEKETNNVGLNARMAAGKRDYASQVPFIARYTSLAPSKLMGASKNLAEADAKYYLWANALRFYNNLERAVKQCESWNTSAQVGPNPSRN